MYDPVEQMTWTPSAFA